jgi:hypothetical protein
MVSGLTAPTAAARDCLETGGGPDLPPVTLPNRTAQLGNSAPIERPFSV